MNWSRRKFLSNSTIATGIAMTGLTGMSWKNKLGMKKGKMEKIIINKVDSDFEREPLIRPFGFKGGYLTEIWQTAAMAEDDLGHRKIGLCTQSVLWSDAKVFAAHSESGGNALMYALTDRALQMIKGESFTNPISLQEKLLPELYTFGQKITQNTLLRKTFILNALVGLDIAMWLLFVQRNKLTNFDDMIPESYRPALAHHHKKVASIPLMSYGVPIEEIKQAVDDGYFFMKIKIGQPGTQEEMLEKDKKRISTIHRAIGAMKTPHTSDGKIPYYFDANGRYKKKETLLQLLDHTRKIGAFDQIVVIEEPFPEESEIYVGDIGVRIAADESAHTDEDALKRIQMGYQAIALKVIAKTLSMTLKIAKVAYENKIPCFCADLTVNPILVEWNKAVAARLAPLPGLDMGLLETNGHQNYKNWSKMINFAPMANKYWTITKNGVFNLEPEYYENSGGIFEDIPHYQGMFK